MQPEHIRCSVFLRKRRRAAALQSALRAQKLHCRCLVLSPSLSWLLVIVTAAVLLPGLLTGCGKEGQEGEEKTVQKSEDDFLDKDAKPDERKYLLAAKPFFVAVASRRYADAYALLSSHARARMSLEQFTPAQQDPNSAKPIVCTRQRYRGTIRLPDAIRRGGAWRTSRAQDAKRVFYRSRRFEPAQQRTIRRDGLDVRHRRDARLDSGRHPAGEFARANPY